jgi:hypothetical protein
VRVPHLRELVVAQSTIGIADQIDHVRVIVLAERLQLFDSVSIIAAIIDRRIGRAVTLSKAGIVEAGLQREGSHATPTTTTTTTTTSFSGYFGFFV